MDNKLPAPDQALRRLWTRTPGYIRLTCAAALVLGLAAHLFMFTNKLPNHDDVGHLFSATYGTASGRWLLPLILRLDGNYSMPWLIGLLALLCLAGAAALTVTLLGIRRPVACVLTAGLLTAFPATAATFSYMFTADAYFFGLFLAALGAYWTVRFPRAGIPAGAAAITCSLGIYQSYFPVAAALLVGSLLLETLAGRRTCRSLILEGLRRVLVLGLAMGVYLVLVRLTTREVGLVDYMGLSAMGQLALRDIPGLVLRCYTAYIDVLLRNTDGYTFSFVKYLLLLAGAVTAFLLIRLLVRQRLGVSRTLLALGLTLLYPLAANLIYLMSGGAQVHSLMFYGSVYLLLLPLALLEAAGPRETSWTAAAGWVLAASLAVTTYSYIVADNRAYLKLDVALEQCAAYSNRLLGAVEQCEGYESGMPIVLLGSGAYTDDLNPTPALSDISLTGVLSLADFRTSYTYDYFLRYYLGYAGPVYLDGSEAAASLDPAQTEALTVYPRQGSIAILDGMAVVKLSEP